MQSHKEHKRKLENKSNIMKGVKGMKQIFFALLAVAFVFSLCFAQEPEESSASASQSAPAVSQAGTKSFTGKVYSVTVDNADEGTKTQIMVTDDNRQNPSFVIPSGALIADKDGNILAPSEIKKDSKVTVTYTTDADGTNVAQSVKVIEQQAQGG